LSAYSDSEEFLEKLKQSSIILSDCSLAFALDEASEESYEQIEMVLGEWRMLHSCFSGGGD
jgi:hypothetical protein